MVHTLEILADGMMPKESKMPNPTQPGKTRKVHHLLERMEEK